MEKMNIMRSCVRNGILNMEDIRTAYSNYVSGKNIFDGISLDAPDVEGFANFLAGGGKTKKEELEVTYGRPYYSYDSQGRKVDNTLNYNATIPEVVIYGRNRKPDYIERAKQERQRQGQIAKSYFTAAPSVTNIAKGIEALVNSSPLVTTASSENPFAFIGDAPSGSVKGNPLNSTTSNLLKWLGKPLTYRPKNPLSQASIEDLAFKKIEGTDKYMYPGLERMLYLWKEKGADLTRFGVDDLDDIFRLRKAALAENAPYRHTIANKIGGEYLLSDFRGGEEVGKIDLGIDASGNTFMDNIHNLTNSYPKGDPRKVHGVQRRGLNSAIAVAQSEGGEGVFSGNQLQSAPKQYPAIFEHPERQVVGQGFHTNEKMVPVGEYGMFGGLSGPKEAKSVEELWANGDKSPMQLLPAPVWKLTKQSFSAPTKSYSFNPLIVDSNGKMHVDWNSADIFKGLVIPTLFGTTYNLFEDSHDK